MDTIITMVRHARHEDVERVLAGRNSRVGLNALGRGQAERIAAVVADRGVEQICSSPQTRAWETARPLAVLAGLPIRIVPEFDEVDFGEWTGRGFDELQRRDDWRRWNFERGTYRPPGGESMAELQARVLHGLFGLAATCAGQRIAIFTHAEPIRAVLLHYRRMKLGRFAQLTIDIASLTTLVFNFGGATIIAQNERPDTAMVPA